MTDFNREMAQCAERFDLGRLLRSLVDPGLKIDLQNELGYSDYAAKVLGRKPLGTYVPASALMPDAYRRDLVVGTSTAGGALVATNLLADKFIELLRERSSVVQFATVLSGLVGNVAIPRQTSAATAYWLAESGSPTESQPAFDQVTLSPKTVGAFTDISRKLILQGTPAATEIVRSDLVATLGLAIDQAAINGSGTSNQPTGILNTTGIHVVNAGGAALGWSHIVGLETQVAQTGDDSGIFYVLHPLVAGTLRTRPKITNGDEFIMTGPRKGATLNGRPAIITSHMPSDKVLCGRLGDLLIGQWGALDLMVDPYTGSTSGTVRVVALQDADVVVRHPESFAVLANFV